MQVLLPEENNVIFDFIHEDPDSLHKIVFSKFDFLFSSLVFREQRLKKDSLRRPQSITLVTVKFLKN